MIWRKGIDKFHPVPLFRIQSSGFKSCLRGKALAVITKSSEVTNVNEVDENQPNTNRSSYSANAQTRVKAFIITNIEKTLVLNGRPEGVSYPDYMAPGNRYKSTIVDLDVFGENEELVAYMLKTGCVYIFKLFFESDCSSSVQMAFFDPGEDLKRSYSSISVCPKSRYITTLSAEKMTLLEWDGSILLQKAEMSMTECRYKGLEYAKNYYQIGSTLVIVGLIVNSSDTCTLMVVVYNSKTGDLYEHLNRELRRCFEFISPSRLVVVGDEVIASDKKGKMLRLSLKINRSFL